jgi:hypothetical protein
MRRIHERPSWGRQIAIVLTVLAAALALIVVALLFSTPPEVFRDNLILRLIREKHSVVHWFSD